MRISPHLRAAAGRQASKQPMATASSGPDYGLIQLELQAHTGAGAAIAISRELESRRGGGLSRERVMLSSSCHAQEEKGRRQCC